MNNRQILQVFILFSIFYFLNSTPVLAAEIFFGAHGKEISLNERFEIGVFLNTQNESINAVEGQIVFPSDSLEFQELYTGNSLLTFWIKQPVPASLGAVSFSGIIPGGFLGPKGFLFSLVFKATKKGKVTISSSQERILLNDGMGTEATITKAPLTLDVTEKEPRQIFTPLYDPNPPEDFQPQIANDPNIFNNKWFLTFAAQDKGYGIDHYQVMETSQLGSFKNFFSKGQWVDAKSPYLLQNQNLESVIYIKAVDRAGNERIVKLKARHFAPFYENYYFWGIIAIIGIIFYKLWKKRFIKNN